MIFMRFPFPLGRPHVVAPGDWATTWGCPNDPLFFQNQSFRNTKIERAAFFQIAFNPNFTIHWSDNSFAQGQTQTRSFKVILIVKTFEHLENVIVKVYRNSNAIVSYRKGAKPFIIMIINIDYWMFFIIVFYSIFN